MKRGILRIAKWTRKNNLLDRNSNYEDCNLFFIFYSKLAFVCKFAENYVTSCIKSIVKYTISKVYH